MYHITRVFRGLAACGYVSSRSGFFFSGVMPAGFFSAGLCPVGLFNGGSLPVNLPVVALALHGAHAWMSYGTLANTLYTIMIYVHSRAGRQNSVDPSDDVY